MIIIFVLFVLYTLGCIADGPDVKPKWKKWLGGKLERVADSLYPIQYVQRPLPEIDNPFMRQSMQISPAKLLESDIVFKTYDFMIPDHIGISVGREGLIERNVRFSKLLKNGINNILMEFGRTAYHQGLIKLSLMFDGYRESIDLHGEMRVVEPERPFFDEPYVLFENSKIELTQPEPFIEMGLISPEQIQY